MGRPLLRYLRLVARPVAFAGSMARVVQGVGVAVVAVGSGTFLGIQFSLAAGIAGALGVALLLAVVAGVQLQRELDRDGTRQIVERELVDACDEATFAVDGGSGAALLESLADWHAKTAEYVGVALGPAASTRFKTVGGGFRFPSDIVEAHRQRLIELASTLNDAAIRVGERELRAAGTKRRANTLRSLMEAAAIETGANS